MADEQQFTMVEALYIRELCKGNQWITGNDALAQHIGMTRSIAANSINILGMSDADIRQASKTAANEAEAAERSKLAYAEKLFAQGYRFRHSGRQIAGLSFDVPPDAIEWRIVSAGYLAMNEARRLEYVVKVD